MGKSLNIALVTPEFVHHNAFDGGLANYCYRLSKFLQDAGHTVEVFVVGAEDKSFDYEGIPVHQVYSQQYSAAFKLKEKVLFKLNKRPDYSKGSLFYRKWKKQSEALNQKLAARHAEVKFDIAHYAHLGGVALYRINELPTVIRLSSSTRLCHEHGGYGEDYQRMLKQEQIEFEALRKADGVFGPSHMIAGIVGKEVDREIEIIETPFSRKSVTEDESLYREKLDGKRYLLFFGSIGRLKGAHTLARIMAPLLREFPELHFVFIGKQLPDGPDHRPMMEVIKEEAAETKDRVIHLGKLPHAQLFPVLRNSEGAVLPSLIDNFPNTCIEAMAYGKLVIGTNGNGFEQLIDHGESGFLVDVDHEEQLLQACRDLLNLESSRKEAMSANALARVERLAPEVITTQLVAFYERHINK